MNFCNLVKIAEYRKFKVSGQNEERCGIKPLSTGHVLTHRVLSHPTGCAPQVCSIISV